MGDIAGMVNDTAMPPDVTDILPGVWPLWVSSSSSLSCLLPYWDMTGYHMAHVVGWVKVQLGWPNQYPVTEKWR